MRVFLTSYATSSFAFVQRELNASAIEWGLSNILSYTEADLHASEYYSRNRSILDEACGAGYWAWKPYFILKACEALEEGDVLFYCDAGSIFIDSPTPLVNLAAEHPRGLVLFDVRPLQNRQFTKRDCFVRLGCDEAAFWDANHVIASILVVRKCPAAIAFLNEWLGYCQDRAALTDDANVCGQHDLSGYLQHRWDQAILSVLAAKHSLETFRNPTLWGNFLKLPEYRVDGEVVTSPYDIPPKVHRYASAPQSNSPYGTIFVINRQPNMKAKSPLPQGNEEGSVTVPRGTALLSQLSQGLKRRLEKRLGR